MNDLDRHILHSMQLQIRGMLSKGGLTVREHDGLNRILGALEEVESNGGTDHAENEEDR